MGQKEKILEILQSGRGLTQRDAMLDYGIGRLASRICDLRKAGYPIVSVQTKGRNRDGKTVYYDTYRMVGNGDSIETDL